MPKPAKAFETALEDGTRTLEDMLAGQPSDFYDIALQAAAAERTAANSKLRRQRAEAKLDTQLRSQLTGAKGKPTQAQVDAAVELHPDYRDAIAQEAKDNDIADRWASLRESYRQRNACLNSRAAMRSK